MHRKLILFAALLLTLVSTAYAVQLAGKWRGSLDSPVGALPMLYTLVHDGGTLTGTLEMELGTFPITDGVIRGDSVFFKADIGVVVFTHRGAVRGDTLFLTVNDGMAEMPTAALARVPAQ